MRPGKMLEGPLSRSNGRGPPQTHFKSQSPVDIQMVGVAEIASCIEPDIGGVIRICCGECPIDRFAVQLAGEAVIDVTVMRLIRADQHNDIAQRRIIGHLPIMFGDRRGGDVRRSALIDS